MSQCRYTINQHVGKQDLPATARMQVRGKCRIGVLVQFGSVRMRRARLLICPFQKALATRRNSAAAQMDDDRRPCPPPPSKLAAMSAPIRCCRDMDGNSATGPGSRGR